MQQKGLSGLCFYQSQKNKAVGDCSMEYPVPERRIMLIVESEPCGCKPFQYHDHENCRLYRERKRLMSEIDKYIEEFKRRIALKGK